MTIYAVLPTASNAAGDSSMCFPAKTVSNVCKNGYDHNNYTANSESRVVNVPDEMSLFESASPAALVYC